MRTREPLSRSEQMARIRGQHTRPERILRSALWRVGLRYRLQAATPVGKPDLVFQKKHVAVFVDGCFWHGCPEHYVRPRSRDQFWAAKLAENVARDREQTLALEELDWNVIRVWEHEVYEALDEAVWRVQATVRGKLLRRSLDWRVVRVAVLDPARNRERRYLEQLRSPDSKKVEDGRRVTAKWRRRVG